MCPRERVCVVSPHIAEAYIMPHSDGYVSGSGMRGMMNQILESGRKGEPHELMVVPH